MTIFVGWLQGTWMPVGPSLVPLDSYGVWDDTIRLQRSTQNVFKTNSTYRPYYEVAPSSAATDDTSLAKPEGLGSEEEESEDGSFEDEDWSVESDECSEEPQRYCCDVAWLVPMLGPSDLPDAMDGVKDETKEAMEEDPDDAMQPLSSAQKGLNAGNVANGGNSAAEETPQKKFGFKDALVAMGSPKPAEKNFLQTNKGKDKFKAPKKGEKEAPIQTWIMSMSRQERRAELQFARPVPVDFDIAEVGSVWQGSGALYNTRDSQR